MRSVIAIFLFAFGIVVSCKNSEPRMKTDWPHGVKYEIFVLAFADGNGDGKGDLKGVTEKLDYLQQLGVNGIWLMPIMPSPSYHKYDVSDYKNIHPDYGTLEDFKKLTEESHKRGIHVIIDLVLNHTAINHPWFESAIKDKDSPYRDYYVWADKDSIRDQIAKKKITLDSDNIRQWHEVNGDSTAEHYYGFFSSHMPDLNFDNQNVRNEMVDVARFWMEEMKVDGFRFDAARHIYPDDRNYDSHQFWLWYRTELQKIKPDIYMVGEVYSVDQNEVSPYAKGLPALFNFKFGDMVISDINARKDSSQFVQTYVDQIDFFKSSNPDFLDAPILTNHDQNRVISQLNNDVQKAKVAASILLTMPGTPYIYYGEELGMRGTKPDEFIREPFLWGDKFTTHWIAPRFTVNDSVPDLAAQQKDENSLYTHYRNLIEARNLSKALTFGSVEPIKDLPSSIIGIKRKFDKEEIVVFHNIANFISVVELKDGLELYRDILFGSNDRISVKKGQLILHPYATVIFKKSVK
jgi:alpha-amylase